MSGISLSLRDKTKQKRKVHGKKKRNALPGEHDDDDQLNNKRTKIHIEEVGAYEESKKIVKVIVPVAPAISRRIDMDGGDGGGKLAYGLNINNDTSLSAGARTPRLGFRADQGNFDDLPEATGQEEYDEVPVKEFGDALLRGMGWDGTDDKDNNGGYNKKRSLLPHEQVGRPEFLGIGVKPGSIKDRERLVHNIDEFMPLVKDEREANDKGHRHPK
ncbi:spliceosome ATPase-activating subunit SPP2 Ecym_4550 [Eremothecium cymbalariae DBVPG|uniref:Pre-mRNA-splicing factor n=1 Tax=Eremothecium cymbalariae (strain CBS 270.75 / DBVPG 7215 / KCTC 17166 / NRRL Y-17582) TaxID=931890 RepID=G8JU82_ERECY|nr:hypothetical protein Ecym_4550 [Eremothecium cymbalariae DBVPG\